MRKDYLKYTDIELYQDEDMFKYNSDTTALGMSLEPMKNRSVLDMGCNNGSLLLYAYLKGATQFIGCDIFQKALDLAKLNLEKYTDNIKLHCCRVQDLEIDPVDVVICNPPYFKMTRDIKENEYYKRAMFEESMPLEDMFKCFRKFCKDNGVVYTLYPANRFIEFYQMAIQYKMKFMSLRFVYDKKKKFALRFIVNMKIGPMKDINILKPVYIDAGDVIFDED